MKTGRKLSLIAAAAVLVLVGGGISYAWFSQHAAMSTLMDILPPDFIDILPVDADGGEMEMLDLDFKDGDIKDEETGEITIRRPVKIVSTKPVHQLEIVHTTNLNQLSFKIYPPKKNENDSSYYYDTNTSLVGSYINPIAPGNSSLAAEEDLNNYKDDDTVEAHAYPLYWLAENSGDSRYVAPTAWDEKWKNVKSVREEKFDPSKQVNKYYYTTYYMLEISWQESTKETDLFYIMARNIDVPEAEGSVTQP